MGHVNLKWAIWVALALILIIWESTKCWHEITFHTFTIVALIMTVFIVLINNHNTVPYTWHKFNTWVILVMDRKSATQIAHVRLPWPTSFCSVGLDHHLSVSVSETVIILRLSCNVYIFFLSIVIYAISKGCTFSTMLI